MRQKLLFDIHDSEQAIAGLEEAVRLRQEGDAPTERERSRAELAALQHGVACASPLLRDAVASDLARSALTDLRDVIESHELRDMAREIEMAARIAPEKLAVARTLLKRLKSTMVRLRRTLAGVSGDADALDAAYTEAHPRENESGESLVDEIRNELVLEGWYTGGVEGIYLELIEDIRRQKQTPVA